MRTSDSTVHFIGHWLYWLKCTQLMQSISAQTSSVQIVITGLLKQSLKRWHFSRDPFKYCISLRVINAHQIKNYRGLALLARLAVTGSRTKVTGDCFSGTVSLISGASSFLLLAANLLRSSLFWFIKATSSSLRFAATSDPKRKLSVYTRTLVLKDWVLWKCGGTVEMLK